jgi:membrane dipeptidase
MLIVDAHQDLAYNMLTFDRDYTRPAAETRRREAASELVAWRDDTLLGWPDYQLGQVALIFATLFATPARLSEGAWDTVCYADLSQANSLYRRQLDLYHQLADENPEKFGLVLQRSDLEAVTGAWDKQPSGNGEGPGAPVGLVILMEGAEGVRSPAELEEWWAGGVRLIGPAWAGNRFCGGTNEPGRLTREGYALLEGMAALNFGLDLSHMDETAALQALDFYPGRILATHSNAKSLLKGLDTNRHLSDTVLRRLIERDGVIGIALYNGFLQPGWKKGDPRQSVSLQQVAAQIDAICQMAGSAHHVGIGSDFDGGFGRQSVPTEIDTIADLQKLVPLLAERGYSPEDTAGILGRNWINLLQSILPDSI